MRGFGCKLAASVFGILGAGFFALASCGEPTIHGEWKSSESWVMCPDGSAGDLTLVLDVYDDEVLNCPGCRNESYLGTGTICGCDFVIDETGGTYVEVNDSIGKTSFVFIDACDLVLTMDCDLVTEGGVLACESHSCSVVPCEDSVTFVRVD